MINGGIIGPYNVIGTSSAKGIWESQDVSEARRNSKWPLPIPPNLVVFDATTGPNSSVTGGWHYEHWDGGTQVSIGTNADSVYTYAPYWSNGAAVANNNIDTTGAVSVTVEVAGNAASYGYAGVSFPGGGITFLADGSVNSRPRTTFVVPVTGGGVGKLNFWAANTYNYCYLYRVVINYS